MKTLIVICILAWLPTAAARAEATKEIHLSDLLRENSLQLCRAECLGVSSALEEKIQKQDESDKAHLLGQLAIWKKSCERACQDTKK